MGKRSGWSDFRLKTYELEKYLNEMHPEVRPPVGEQELLGWICDYFRERGPSPVRHPESRQMLWLIWHRECGDIAFLMTENPRDTTIKSSNVLYPGDWGAPEPHSEMICYSCRERIKKTDLLETPPPRKRLITSPGVVH